MIFFAAKKQANALFSRVFMSFLFAAVLSLTACSSKVTPPPSMGGEGSGGYEYGDDTNANYPDSGSLGGSDPFSEDNLPMEGTLDDTVGGGKNGGAGGYGADGYGGLDPDSQANSYKKQHGRCTAGFEPIYFAFDQARISSEMMSTAERNAAYLRQNPSLNVRLEGNSDQRGTNEYNMALSERRAMNVLQYLQNVGIDTSRIRTIAYGEEMPLFPGNSEEDYQYNRRVDFVAE